MTYTETRDINGRKYYYRVSSVRKGKKVSKKRVYLGAGISPGELRRKEKGADERLSSKKAGKTNMEIEKIKGKIIKILKKYKVTKAGIFGSYARGEQKKKSDIDIVVNIDDDKMSLLGFIALLNMLEEALRRKVDLVEYSAIKPGIKDRILNEEIRII